MLPPSVIGNTSFIPAGSLDGSGLGTFLASAERLPMITYFRAIFIGLVQGVTELFPHLESRAGSDPADHLRLGSPRAGAVAARVFHLGIPRRTARRDRHGPVDLLLERVARHHRGIPPNMWRGRQAPSSAVASDPERG